MDPRDMPDPHWPDDTIKELGSEPPNIEASYKDDFATFDPEDDPADAGFLDREFY